ncbi:MAG: hypothetical protein RLZZ584_3638, partial [Pseudomonadota bacterium]
SSRPAIRATSRPVTVSIKPVGAKKPLKIVAGAATASAVRLATKKPSKPRPTPTPRSNAVQNITINLPAGYKDGAAIVKERLRQRARAAGIAPERLVFAPLMDKPRHLERLRLADLVLDTRIYNGHTTMSDALWAGVPVLSVLGPAFAGRVGRSLLTAAGLPQAATADLDAYEAQARALLRHPRELLAWRRQLAEARATAPLWDTAGFVRGLEGVIDRCWAGRFGP